jgi:hypothetical protein
MEGNYFLEIFLETLRASGWVALDFRYWRIRELKKNRSKCAIIQLHWPESYWRNRSSIKSLLKALHFIGVHTISKHYNFKWMFIAHNVIPHFQAYHPRIERMMRHYILSTFDCIVALAKNTRTDLIEQYNTCGKWLVQARHATYDGYYAPDLTRKELRMHYGISEDTVVLWLKGSTGRENQGTDAFVRAWSENNSPLKNKIVLLYTHRNDNLPDLTNADKSIFTVKGYISDNDMANFAIMSDYLLFNYGSITTSGMFYFALTMNLCVIAPNIPFFAMNSSEDISIIYDNKGDEMTSIQNILKYIESGWHCDRVMHTKMRDQHKAKKSYQPVINAMGILNEE